MFGGCDPAPVSSSSRLPCVVVPSNACVVVLWDWCYLCMQQDQQPAGSTLHCSCKSCTPVRHRHCIVCTSQYCVYPTSINTKCWPASAGPFGIHFPLVCWYLCAARCAACSAPLLWLFAAVCRRDTVGGGPVCSVRTVCWCHVIALLFLVFVSCGCRR